MKNTILKISALSAVVLLAAGCATTMPPVAQAVAELQSKSGSAVKGVVTFNQLAAGGVQVSGTISGLKPNQEHGFHVHEKGDCSSPDGMSAGGHFNPEAKAHGSHTSAAHHAGDMPNLKADANGVATFAVLLADLTVLASKTSVLERSVIVHVNPDDYTSQPVGNAGGRMACGLVKQIK